MKETVLPELLAFLAKAPALEGITLRTEEAGPAPGAGGLWPRAGNGDPALPGGISAAAVPAAAPRR